MERVAYMVTMVSANNLQRSWEFSSAPPSPNSDSTGTNKSPSYSGRGQQKQLRRPQKTISRSWRAPVTPQVL